MSDLGFGNVNTTLSGNNGGEDEKQKTKAGRSSARYNHSGTQAE